MILEAQDDHNGAFQQDQRNLFNQIQKKYAIAYEKVSDIEDIAESINRVLQNNNKIKAIWLRAHGNPQGICLDKHSWLDIHNVALLKHHFRQIDPNGFIILDACSTGGKPSRGSLNIAHKIARVVEGRTVIASSQDTTSFFD